MLRERLWHTRTGQIACALVTGNDHVFSGWDTPMHPLGSPTLLPDGRIGREYPYAYCDRCGHDF